jgi:hypothetical protein
VHGDGADGDGRIGRHASWHEAVDRRALRDGDDHGRDPLRWRSSRPAPRPRAR